MNKKAMAEYEQLYIQNKDNIFRICFLYLKDYQLAEDATQETFCRAFRKRNLFRKKSDIKTWITSIAINICKNMIKKKSYAETATEESTFINIPCTEVNIDEKLTLSTAVAQLPVALREVILLYYYQEITQKEIAKILKIPETTVAYRLRTAKEKLRAILKEDYYE